VTAWEATAPPPEVLIMAGGEGRRLAPLTARTPKPMLPIRGRPVLQRLLEGLRDQGVEHAFLAVRHLSEVIREYFGDGSWLGMDIDYVVEGPALGTAGAIGLLPQQSTPLLVLNGDLVVRVPLGELLRFHANHIASMTVAHVDHRIPTSYGVIECRGADAVAVHEKPDVILTVVAGIYVLASDVVATVRRGRRLDMPELIEEVMEGGRVVGFPLRGPWADIGTPETYARAQHVDRGLWAGSSSASPDSVTQRIAPPILTGGDGGRFG
jgi:NDP-sugar pyrophosphorylase family protein